MSECQRAGVIVRMVTGDHIDTATYIARQCGIVTDSSLHLTMIGEDFRKMIDAGREEELEKVIPKLRVLARSSPKDKEKLVKWLKKKGQVCCGNGRW